MSKLSVGFNQDSSLITVGSTRGFSVYRCNPFKKCFQAADGSIKFVEMLFSTSLVALVGSGKQAAFSPRRIRLYSTKTRQFICELDFATTVLNVKMNNKRLVAVLETKIHIFDLETLNILHTLRTPSNPRGVIALSSNVNNGFMALPGHDSKGEILIYDVINCQVRSSNNACNNPIQNLSMNAEGTMLAAASTQGTVIRVFSVPDGALVHSFRRGSYPVTIHSIAFSGNNSHIAVSSTSNTIHIFELKSQDKPNPKTKPSASITSYLPNLLCNMIKPERHFAFVNQKDSSHRTVVAFNEGYLLVLSEQGYFCRYIVPEKGGECKLGMEFPLVEKPDEEMGVKIHGQGAAQTLFDVQHDAAATGDKKRIQTRLSKEHFETVFHPPPKTDKILRNGSTRLGQSSDSKKRVHPKSTLTKKG
uniref:WD repeat domain phosphoinositide-interacting protein 2 n=1 Tax=Lotharella globosa TaxID=91324 RepID=A0A7S4DQ40_9EUKA|mmetsp:Transcript_12800/g.26136  ORF Transcript_12800/g.26136 Transcript_12800/m.26136 type:complete len:418 (-) Transcript_12800:1741-2994(-)